MEIPKRIKVGGHWYTVKYPYVYKEKTDAWASLAPGSKTIFIGADDGCGGERPESSILGSFIHEILHAIDLVYFDNTLFDKEIKEQRVSVLSEAILQVLVDNGWLNLEASDVVRQEEGPEGQEAS